MERPFDRIAMDIVGPLPKSTRGYQYILVLCDYATKFPEAIPLRTITASAVAERLIDARYGIPGEIQTDQGTNFTSQLLKELYRLLGVQAIRTTPYHPKTDGLVERFNKTLKDLSCREKEEVACITRPEKNKLSAIREYTVPKTKKDVRAFLGLTGYYRRFIPNYASIAKPLTDLTRKITPDPVPGITSVNRRLKP